ncbi:hypothetical protein D3C73_1386280 [compost metagenome]
MHGSERLPISIPYAASEEELYLETDWIYSQVAFILEKKPLMAIDAAPNAEEFKVKSAYTTAACLR